MLPLVEKSATERVPTEISPSVLMSPLAWISPLTVILPSANISSIEISAPERIKLPSTSLNKDLSAGMAQKTKETPDSDIFAPPLELFKTVSLDREPPPQVPMPISNSVSFSIT